MQEYFSISFMIFVFTSQFYHWKDLGGVFFSVFLKTLVCLIVLLIVDCVENIPLILSLQSQGTPSK